MSVRGIKAYIKSGRAGSAGFLIINIFFFFGVLLGAISANYITIDNAKILKELFLNSGSLFYTGKGFLSTFLTIISYNILSIVLGFTIFGFVLIPLLSGARGFFLSFSIAALMRALGKGGLVIAFSRFGFPALIYVPCFFILCIQAFYASYNLTSKIIYSRSSGSIYDKNYFLRCVVCIAALLLAAVLETYISPILTAVAAGY